MTFMTSKPWAKKLNFLIMVKFQQIMALLQKHFSGF